MHISMSINISYRLIYKIPGDFSTVLSILENIPQKSSSHCHGDSH